MAQFVTHIQPTLMEAAQGHVPHHHGHQLGIQHDSHLPHSGHNMPSPPNNYHHHHPHQQQQHHHNNQHHKDKEQYHQNQQHQQQPHHHHKHKHGHNEIHQIQNTVSLIELENNNRLIFTIVFLVDLIYEYIMVNDDISDYYGIIYGYGAMQRISYPVLIFFFA